jgi:hypothetical protein
MATPPNRKLAGKQRKPRGLRIAVLGWGSLIWDPHPIFDQHHRDWQFDGPRLNLEFSRISKTRAGVVTAPGGSPNHRSDASPEENALWIPAC